MFARIREDVRNVLQHDPAATITWTDKSRRAGDQ